MADAGRGVGLVLVERLVLEQRVGQRVELFPVGAEKLDDLLVGLVHDPAHLLVDQLLRSLGDLTRPGEERATAVSGSDRERPDRRLWCAVPPNTGSLARAIGAKRPPARSFMAGHPVGRKT